MDKQKGKEISYLLRHNPKGLYMDNNGWVYVEELLSKVDIDMEELEDIVANNDKKRFAFNEDKTKIRALQGHSIYVDVELKKKTPPKYLYHGTAFRNVPSIKKNGLNKMKRLHVHLSSDYNTALNVASRYCKDDKPYVFTIDTYPMIVNGIDFYQSENGVWLVDYVAPKYLK